MKRGSFLLGAGGPTRKTRMASTCSALDEGFPREMARTKQYGYSLFVLEAVSTICQIDDLWHFHLPDGRRCRFQTSVHTSVDTAGTSARATFPTVSRFNGAVLRIWR